MDRSTFASWLQGPRSAAETAGADLGYPGQRLGLLPAGPGSVAGFGARLVAVAIDWLSCLLIVWVFSRGHLGPGSENAGGIVLVVFAAEVAVLTWLGGASFGQRLRRLRVVSLDGPRVGLVAALLRTVMLCLFIPAVIWDRDGRGLHDRAARTVVVRA